MTVKVATTCTQTRSFLSRFIGGSCGQRFVPFVFPQFLDSQTLVNSICDVRALSSSARWQRCSGCDQFIMGTMAASYWRSRIEQKKKEKNTSSFSKPLRKCTTKWPLVLTQHSSSKKSFDLKRIYYSAQNNSFNNQIHCFSNGHAYSSSTNYSRNAQSTIIRFSSPF